MLFLREELSRQRVKYYEMHFAGKFIFNLKLEEKSFIFRKACWKERHSSQLNVSLKEINERKIKENFSLDGTQLGSNRKPSCCSTICSKILPFIQIFFPIDANDFVQAYTQMQISLCLFVDPEHTTFSIPHNPTA